MKKECTYNGCVHEEVINRNTWMRILNVGHERDVNKGGYADSQSECVKFWCGPDNKPKDPYWERVDIRRCELNYPRSYVGGVYGEWGEESNEVILHFVIMPYEKAEVIVGEGFFGSIFYEGLGKAVGDFVSDADLKWMISEFEKLRKEAKIGS